MLSERGRNVPSIRRVAAAAVSLLMLSGVFATAPESAALAAQKPKPARSAAPANKRVPLITSRPQRSKVSRKPPAPFSPSGHSSLPEATHATVTPAGRVSGQPKPAPVRAGRTPVSVAASGTGRAPGRVQVTTVDQGAAARAGVHGLLFTLAAPDGGGDVEVSVDDASFRYAWGGDYAARLHLVQLPACALTTPASPKCQVQTAVPSIGARLTGRVSVPAAGTVLLAATSGTGGTSGDYAATSLSTGGTWSAGGNTGAFTYTYLISVPPAINGAAPNVDLFYDSASQDARTDGTNNQSSWLGDGWSSSDNYVERSYKSCSDVTGSGAPEHDGDECWAGQVVTLSLNGKSTPIVYDDDSHNFRAQTDDAGIKVEDLPGAANGTTNGEYFRVTEKGVQYYFGLGRLPGWSGDEETKSAWTVPVYHAHGAVPACPDGSFADTACTLGWRFNLDYVVDPNNNAMAYYYAPEIGYYGADMKNKAVSYVRGGTLKRIDYGLTPSTVYSGAAPAEVDFDATAERCFAGKPDGNTCSEGQFTVAHPEYWPDVPIDLACTSDATDCTNHGPSFWSRKRLTSILTQVRVGGAAKQVDRYDFTQSFPDGGDHAPTLWLDGIKRTGLDKLGGADGPASAGSVSFDPPLQLPNRVGTVPGPKMYHDRIQIVTTETGAETTVAYNTPDCSGVSDVDPSDNTTACFPVYWTPDYQPDPLLDWFYTHTVRSVTTIDPHDNYQDGTEPELVTEYSYQGTPAWHFDDNEIVKSKNRTWGQFRGYPEVDTTTGDPRVFHYTNKAKVYDRKTLTKTYYFTGMKGDTLPGGKTRNAPDLVSQDKATTVPDDDALAGSVFETDTYTADGETIDKATVTVPTIIGPTASRARGGLPPLTAVIVRHAKTLTRQAVSYGWRKTESDTFYDTKLGQSTTGLELQSDDRGEPGAAGNVAHCTFTSYLDSTRATVVVPAEVISTDQDCHAAGAKPAGTLIADVRTSYDGHGYTFNGDSTPGVKAAGAGNPTLIQRASAANGVAATAFVDEGVTAYDGYGRVSSVTRTPNSTSPDGKSLAQTVSTSYSPATGALPTATTTITQVTPGTDCSTATKSSKDCEVASTDLDAARQLPIGQTDVAGLLTSTRYDALGRLTAVWLPNQSKAANGPANQTYTYNLSADHPSVVSTGTLLEDGTYRVDKTLYDALLRKLEIQATGENNSTTVTDTQYDSHGWVVVSNNAYSVQGAPSDSLISDHISQVTIPDQTITDHDGMGRTTLSTEEANGARTWDTRTAYAGDTTTVLPPTGSVATTTTVDARNQVVRLQQYTDLPALSGTAATGYTASGGQSQSIAYGYTAAGQRSAVTGPDGSAWTLGYDLAGKETSHTDPDTGSSTLTYDDAGNLTSTVDAAHAKLDYTYDLLGRKLTASDKGFTFAKWTYDSLRIGKPASSTRYVPGVTGGYTVAPTGYSRLGKVMGTKITLPPSEAPLPTTYTTTNAYSINTELLQSKSDPRTQGLLGETIDYGYDTLGLPATTESSIALYVSGAVYSDLGQPSRVTMGASTNEADVIYSYEDQTLRLKERRLTRAQAPGPEVDDTTYTYDDSDNPLSVVDHQSETGNTVTDTQCFRYDRLARLSQAWTAAGDCPSADAGATADGVSNGTGSYWQTYGYDIVGGRTQVVDHSTTGGADQSTTYNDVCTAACGSAAQPHTLASTTGADAQTFHYDVDGRLTTRTAASGEGQTLTWDDEGHLAKVDTTGGANAASTTYLYDADGNQLIRRDPGRTTLFAGDTQIVVNTAVTPHVLAGGVRTYTLGGGGAAVAVHSSLPGGGTHYLLDDPHGTASLAMDTTTQKVARQQFTPYGESRAAANPATWPDATHGYLGLPQDAATGYSDLGARKYDPSLGRFISADPILEVADPNQLGGYTYAGDNPVRGADPTGLAADYCVTAACRAATGGDRPDSVLGAIETEGHGGGSSSHTATKKSKGSYVHVGPAVVMRADDPELPWVQMLYKGYSGSYLFCLWMCSEESKWQHVCAADPNACPKEFKHQLNAIFNAKDPLSGDDEGAEVLIESPASGNPVFRSLLQPKTMVGATLDDLRAMVPKNWKEIPLKDGNGVRIGSPGKNASDFGSKGWVEFNDGYPGGWTAMHQGKFIRLSAGGLRYRVAADGNAAAGTPDEVEILQSGNPGASLSGATDIGIEDLPIPE
jgi:RHS repeat-associated protein